AMPVALSDLVSRLMAKDPALRPPSARAVADALAAVEANQTGSRAAPPVRTPLLEVVPAAEPAAEDPPEAVPDSAPAAPESMPRWVSALIFDAAAVLLLLTGLYCLIRTLIG